MSDVEYLSLEEVRALLEAECAPYGGQIAFARKAGLSPQFINDVRKGRRGFGLPLLAALGVGREISVRYVRLKR